MTTTRLPDGKVVANVHSGRADILGGSETASTYECTKRQGCERVAIGGGVTSGASALLGTVFLAGTGVYAADHAAAAVVNSFAPTVKASAKANSKAIGPGSSIVKVNSTNVNQNKNSAKAQNFNKN
jgi:hypothetical protein